MLTFKKYNLALIITLKTKTDKQKNNLKKNLEKKIQLVELDNS